MNWYDQSDYQVRFDWGPEGITALGPISDTIVVVDVLSFTTAVDVAVSRNAVVLPFGWKDDRAVEYARQQDAILAVGRGKPGLSLSPQSLAELTEGDRVVLPSPNGSTLTIAASQHGTTIAGSLRNRSAIAEYVSGRIGTVAVIACGERWMPDNTLRPAIEDQIGAGAIIDLLPGRKSPEAESAVVVFTQASNDLEQTLMNCASGRELVDKGYLDDVSFAAAIDSSRAVPVLENRAYRNVST